MADLLQSKWPYISDTEAQRILTLTSPGTINGVAIADLDLALTPVGGLGLSLNGRTAERFELAGHLNLPNFDQSVFESISAFDGLGRDFSVDLSGLVTNATGNNWSAPVSSVAGIWSANLIHGQGLYTLKSPMYWGYFIYLPTLEFGFDQTEKFKDIFSHLGKIIC